MFMTTSLLLTFRRANVCIIIITDLSKKKYKVSKRKLTLHQNFT